LAYCNIHVGLSGNVHHTKSTATYDKESDMIRLEVIPGSMLLKPKPNQHYYLYQPGTLRCWENHPFTLAHWEEVRTSSPSTSLTSSNTTFTNTKSNSNTKIATSSSSLSSTTPDSPIDQSPDTTTKSDSLTATTGSNRLLFYIRPFNGWTQRLRSDCLRKPSSITNPTILIEGPYGHSAPLHAYENIVFITGGTGIAGATAYLTDHLARSATGTTCTTNITLLWATKQAAMIRAIAAKELAPVRGRNDVCTSFYTTGRHEVAASLETKTPDDATSGSLVSDVEITYGRPNIAAVLQGVIDVVAAAGSKGGRIAVLVCGPAGMADEARSAVHKALKDGRRGVEYLEETFGW
jgi:NAD(P)H-flavin reductase